MAAPDSPRDAPRRPTDSDETRIHFPQSRSARLRFEAPEDLLGHTLNDRYKILEQLGSGGMGTVYLAEHVLINKRVAVKVLSPAHSRKPDEVERFLREARAASRIRQENVVDITDFGYTSGGLAFLVMEYLEGEDLSTTSSREGALPWRRAVHITRQICAALTAAHAQGVIHRDMKPENVFRVSRGDDPDFIKVLDFGIAKIIDEQYDPEHPSHTNSGLMGTPEYVAPELIRGLVPDVRVDIYAVGVILYRLLTGVVPFAGETFMATLTQHLMSEAVPPRQAAPDAEIPADLEAVCLKSLARDRDERYSTIHEMAQALLATQAAAVLARPVAEPPTPQRRLLPVLVGVVGVIVVAAIAVWAYAAGRESAPEPQAAVTAVAGVAVSIPDLPDPPGRKEQAPVPAPVVEPAPVVAVVPEAPEPVEPEPVADEPPKAEPSRKSGGARPPALPERLTTIELSGGMSKLAGRVRTECSKLAMRKMAVGLRVEVAASGKVKSATPKGLQSEALGTCVAKIAKTAKYRAARQGSEFEYTFRM
ncbi:MAG TPA: serine/threonine-protein kinase [Nannocystis sp.]